MVTLSLILGVVLFVAPSVSATLGHHRDNSPRITPSPPPSFKRGMTMHPISTATASFAGLTTSLNNTGNNFYSVNITLGGSVFALQLDTGSSDLVLLPNLPINTTSVIKGSEKSNETYALGSFAGPIAVATLEFGGHRIESQAFLNATSIDPVLEPVLLARGIRGYLGVELTTFPSEIRNELVHLFGPRQGAEMGRTVLANMFDQHAELGNFTVIRLGRSDDGEGPGVSYLDVGEYPEDLKGRFESTKSIETVTPGDFSLLVDAMSVDGKKVPLKSSVRGVPSGKAVANLDTGTSSGELPKDILDAMYGGIPGALFSDSDGMWIVPCLEYAPNISLTIGGQQFSIHPLDLTDITDLRPTYNYTICTSSFSSFTFDNNQPLDFLMGDSFLRNVVASYYYGTFGDNATDVIKSPSIKLLSTSNGVDADYSDFLTRRRRNLASLPPQATKAQVQKIMEETQSNSSDASAAKELASSGGSNGDSYQALLDKLNIYAPVVFGLLGAIFVVLLGLLGVGVALCIRRSRIVGAVRTGNPLYSPVPLRFKEPESEYKDEENVRYGQ